MKDLVPEYYFGKKLKVYTYSGTVTVGELDGYSYDYDDDGAEYMELDFDIPGRIGRFFREDEIEKIVIIGESDR